MMRVPALNLKTADEVILNIRWLHLADTISPHNHRRPDLVPYPVQASASVSPSSSHCNHELRDVLANNGESDAIFSDFVEVWTIEQTNFETIEPIAWPPLVQPTEVEIFKPRVLILQG